MLKLKPEGTNETMGGVAWPPWILVVSDDRQPVDASIPRLGGYLYRLCLDKVGVTVQGIRDSGRGVRESSGSKETRA